MKMKHLLFLLGSVMVASVASAQTVIQNTTYSATAPAVVSGANTVSATPNVTVNSGATVVYQATGSITLGPGFSVTKGGKFFAMVSATLDTDGDGIPDVWELAYGLNPNSAADASALSASGSGLTNLQMYLSGQYPLPYNLQNATMPSGYQVVLLTPGNNLYGVDTVFKINPLPVP